MVQTTRPNHSFSLILNHLRCFCRCRVLDDFRYIRYNREQLEPKAAPFCPFSAENHVLFDFVVEVTHVAPRVTHPVLVQAFGALRVVPAGGLSGVPHISCKICLEHLTHSRCHSDLAAPPGRCSDSFLRKMPSATQKKPCSDFLLRLSSSRARTRIIGFVRA